MPSVWGVASIQQRVAVAGSEAKTPALTFGILLLSYAFLSLNQLLLP